jgi:hypothetical protein
MHSEMLGESTCLDSNSAHLTNKTTAAGKTREDERAAELVAVDGIQMQSRCLLHLHSR